MLKYSVKLETNIDTTQVEWRDRYISPDLKYCSGTTDSGTVMSNIDSLTVNSLSMNGNNRVSCYSVKTTLDGVLFISGLQYTIGEDVVVPSDEDVEIRYKYIFYNGKYYYAKVNEPSDTVTFTIDDFTIYNDQKLSSATQTISGVPTTATTVKIDTYFPIYGGRVMINGNMFYTNDFQTLSQNPNAWSIYLKETDNDDSEWLKIVDVVDCDSYKYVKVGKDVTRFELSNTDASKKLSITSMTPCTVIGFVNFNDRMSIIRKRKNDNGVYVWSVSFPRHVVDSRLDFTSKQAMESNVLDNLYFDVYGGTECSIYYDNTDFGGKVISAQTEEDLPDIYTMANKSYGYVTINYTDYPLTFDYVPSTEGIYLMASSNEQYTLIKDDIYECSAPGSTYGTVYVNDDFVIVHGQKYTVQEDVSDYIIVGDIERNIKKVDDDSSRYLVEMGGDYVLMNYSNGQLTTTDYAYDDASGTSASTASYEIYQRDGIVINDKTYPVIIDDGGKYIDYDGEVSYKLKAVGRIGVNNLIFEPMTWGFMYRDRIQLEERIVYDICTNSESFAISKTNHLFGYDILSHRNGFMNYYNSDNVFPRSSDGLNSIKEYMHIFKNSAKSLRINIPMSNNANLDMLRSDTLNERFFKKESEKAINKIIDMEKDIYIPKFIEKDQIETKNYKDISEIRFNFHFRTRSLENWKVIENQEPENTAYANWFVTDWEPYKAILNSGDSDKIDNLQETSDLTGLLGFSNSDIYYKKSRVGKSFIRLTYYDSMDSLTQNLLAMSTIYLDDDNLVRKYISNMKNGTFKMIDDNEIDVDEFQKSVSVLSESATTANTFIINEETEEKCRLDSRIIVRPMNYAEKSSEGFYMYMYKNYSEGLHPQAIYLKIEFNHAGVGQTIPMIVPMKYTVSGDTMIPERIKLSNSDDLNRVKSGYPLSIINEISYIPLYAVYDEKNKEYAYIFDDRYTTYNDGILNISLFEPKIGNVTLDQIKVTNRRSRKKEAVTNVKPKLQLNPMFFK